jgi:hypothetical protein
MQFFFPFYIFSLILSLGTRVGISTYQDALARGKSEEGGHDFWDTEERDLDQACG